MILNELKLIDLSDSQNLIEIPDLSGAPNLKQLFLDGCTRLSNIHPSLGNLKKLILLYMHGCRCLNSLPLMINLEALETFDLSGCSKLKNFPHSVENMPRLRKLCLSETAIKDLSLLVIHSIGLIELDLRDCKNLSSLPIAICSLMSLQKLYLSGCSKLDELLENLGKMKESDFRPEFSLLGCNKLIKNQDYGDRFSTMLRRHLINTQDQFYSLEIPGSEIPKCFSHQNVGFSVNLQGPSDLLGNRLMGIAVCAVFVFRKHDPGCLSCSFNGSPEIDFHFPMKFGKIESYQLLLHYCPSTFLAGFKEILNKVDANGFSQIEVKFKPSVGLGEVTKCGARLVFERDIEDLINQTKAGPSFEDSEKDTKIKRSRDDFDGEGAGPSGEATSNDVDEPHPKRIRLPNLIERLIPRLGNWLRNSSTQEQGDSDCEEEKSQ
nr:disease resistance protein rpp5 [Quercus suber]